jgi:hypothetical protein
VAGAAGAGVEDWGGPEILKTKYLSLFVIY